jgi:hypothetical protein
LLGQRPALSQHALRSRDIGRIDQHGNADGLGHQLVQKCQPLGSQLSCEKIDPKLDRVFGDAEDDRGRRGRSFGCKRSKVASWRGDNGYAPALEVRHERRKAIELALQPVVLHRHVLALDEARFVKAPAERGAKGRIG